MLVFFIVADTQTIVCSPRLDSLLVFRPRDARRHAPRTPLRKRVHGSFLALENNCIHDEAAITNVQPVQQRDIRRASLEAAVAAWKATRQRESVLPSGTGT